MYADIPSHTLPGGGTVPPHLLVTAEKPDLVIIDRMEEKMDIFELTVPLETNIKNANAQKMNNTARNSLRKFAQKVRSIALSPYRCDLSHIMLFNLM